MTAQELRICNLISKNDVIWEVDKISVGGEITVSNFPQDNNMMDIRLDEMSPIRLTEEWLVKFGFKEVKPRVGVAMSYKKNGIRINISNSGNTYYKNLSISSVHKLQNLYFALVGNELEIK